MNRTALSFLVHCRDLRTMVTKGQNLRKANFYKGSPFSQFPPIFFTGNHGFSRKSQLYLFNGCSLQGQLIYNRVIPFLRPPKGVCEAHLHQAYKPYLIIASDVKDTCYT